MHFYGWNAGAGLGEAQGYLTSIPSTSLVQISVVAPVAMGVDDWHWAASGICSQMYSIGLADSCGEPRTVIEAMMAMRAITSTRTGIGTKPFI